MGVLSVVDAELCAAGLLADLPARWVHTQAVAGEAVRVGGLILDGVERDVLVAAAWLHDVGYASSLALTGSHHLDGAVFLAASGESRLARLVAHHSSGAAEIERRGLGGRLVKFASEPGLLADALTFCDLSVGPGGCCVSLTDRLADVSRRYGPTDVVVRGLDDSQNAIAASFARVEAALAAAAAVSAAVVLDG